MERYDAIVIGLGAMGSAAAFRLARRGTRVLGLEDASGGPNISPPVMRRTGRSSCRSSDHRSVANPERVCCFLTTAYAPTSRKRHVRESDWFQPTGDLNLFALKKFPIFKVARHHTGENCTPATVRREIEMFRLRRFLGR